MAKLDFIPLCCSFLDSSRQALSRLAISDNESSKIYIYDGKNHGSPVTIISYCPQYDLSISCDQELIIGFQLINTLPNEILFKSKLDTDLFELVKRKLIPLALEFNSTEEQFALHFINQINLLINLIQQFFFQLLIKNKFYLFTRNNPQDNRSEHDKNRDIYNEKPSREEILTATGEEVLSSLSQSAMIYTTYGGQSIWGKDFQDEFNPQLKRECPYTLSVANAGPNINVSQFFITVVPCP
ncbi:unnamed protein product [Rotaria magnacalcarata]